MDPNPALYGQEYILNLAGDIAKEFDEIYDLQDKTRMNTLSDLVNKILPFMFKNGDEISAVDLLMDVESLDRMQ